MSYEHCCKVGRIADKHNLTTAIHERDINEELIAKWKGRGMQPETSVRELVDWFNYKILKNTYINHDRPATETKLDVEFESLTGDDDDRRWMVKQELEDDGVDADSLLSDFITKSTLYRHLTQCLNEKKQQSSGDTDWEREKIEYMRDTSASKIEEVLRSWENKDVIPNATDSDVSVSVYLNCPECSTSTSIERARQRGYVCEEHMGSREGEKGDEETNAKI
jgi:hypothetical protein